MREAFKSVRTLIRWLLITPLLTVRRWNQGGNTHISKASAGLPPVPCGPYWIVFQKVFELIQGFEPRVIKGVELQRYERCNDLDIIWFKVFVEEQKAMQASRQADFQGVQSVLRNFYQDFIIMYGKSTEENWNIFQKQLEDIWNSSWFKSKEG